jgi:aspartyl-tRNA synthetase
MSFVGEEDVMAVNEGFLKTVFREALGVEIETPFLKLPYREAMERYGSDKPDLRFGFELRDLSPLMAGCGFKVFSDAVSSGGSVRAVNIEGAAESFSRKEIDSLAEFVKAYGAKGLAWMKFSGGGIVSPIAKFFSEEELREIRERTGARDGDLLLFAADRDRVVLPALGALRCECARRLGILSPADYRFLWVTEFPLLEYDEEEKRYAAMHHPFTSPVQEDLPLLDVSPGEVRARAYDVVLNGVEIGGGSIRIHQPELQEKMFGVLGFTKEQAWARFGFLMEAFKFGPPPHGGLAYGLDRLVMLMAGRESIRDVIAFPKVQNAAELMSGAPDAVDERQLSELSIRVETPE